QGHGRRVRTPGPAPRLERSGDSMLKILGIVAAVIVAAVVVVLVLAARQPDVFRVQRATLIKAPPDKIFPLINDFRNWGAWSRWERMDPAMKRSYMGPPAGKGAVYEWEGSPK